MFTPSKNSLHYEREKVPLLQKEHCHVYRNSANKLIPAAAAAAKPLQSCLTLCKPIEDSPPGSSVPGILQARILEWVAISCSIYSPSKFQMV